MTNVFLSVNIVCWFPALPFLILIVIPILGSAFSKHDRMKVFTAYKSVILHWKEVGPIYTLFGRRSVPYTPCLEGGQSHIHPVCFQTATPVCTTLIMEIHEAVPLI